MLKSQNNVIHFLSRSPCRRSPGSAEQEPQHQQAPSITTPQQHTGHHTTSLRHKHDTEPFTDDPEYAAPKRPGGLRRPSSHKYILQRRPELVYWCAASRSRSFCISGHLKSTAIPFSDQNIQKHQAPRSSKRRSLTILKVKFNLMS